ncbi:(2Fe-2S)-binding protein [Aestuariispira insulae]|uniref:Isoquinoline 1-oxidoreductase alpha subunit n=1 Tax=Aestuariispira insulae TaxID=1461337 RepID=A0A3D9HYF7_9PROT|nr:(2Fe-2S)-binding protein [Aestuariispira insulae]RED54391.1 isoquinoline 1-oxidoreductase alpha subunit [Aestuariispira insulae]
MIKFKLNNEERTVDADPDTPLLWVIRDEIGLTGTKFGCGQGLCGACTVHLDGEAVRSCQTFVGDVEGLSVTTIEGIGSKAAKAVQTAWQSLEVPQCGYCQSGQIMQATALLTENAKPSDAEIDEAMNGNVCRCATYVRIRKAIHHASELMEA